MMQSPQILRIVVASPGDVQAERDSLEEVAAELNRGVAAMAGLRIEISRWETHAFPGFHPEGPQGLIDPLLKIEECDLLIGIFWKHFGTPTGDASSGTEHEFHTAYAAWKRSGRPQIMVYFNQKAHAPKTKAEAEQWTRVLEFQESFPPEGLWWPYRGKAQFERLVRNHLTQWIRQRAALPEAPSPPVGTPERHNLPVATTPFIGRAEELRDWHDLLRDPARRLLTLTGFGGMGKTRTALELAWRCVDAFAEGVWWVELAEARSGPDMLQRIAYRLRLPLQPQPSIPEQIEGFLRGRELLLVLDETEQVPDAGAVIHALLEAAPRLSILVTSRRVLELRAEEVAEVLPLPGSESQALFLASARARNSRFAPTAQNASDIAELCRRLEGVPLAIELAAARMGEMTPREALRRLRERFAFLRSNAPDLPPRQRALRGTMDWSYALLAEEEKTLFAQLAVFAGGFTMDDAEAICTVPNVMEGVTALRRHSLLGTAIDPEGQETRYTLLESLREYAAERLRALPDTESQIRLRHAQHFLAFAERRIAGMRTPEEATALRQFDAQRENLRVALEWAQRQENHEVCARIGRALGIFFGLRGFPAEALLPVEAGLSAARQINEAHPLLYADLLRERAGMHLDHSQYPEALARANEALALYEKLGDLVRTARTENLLGEITRGQGNLAAAREHFGRALVYSEQTGDSVIVAIACNNLGLIEIDDPSGDRQAAARYLNEALRLGRAAGDARGLAETLNNLGVLAHTCGDWEEAHRRYEEALRHEQELGHTLGVACALSNLGEVAMEQERAQDACRLFAAAERLFRDMESPHLAYTTDWLEKAAAACAGSEAAVKELRESVQDKSLDDLISWALGGP